MNTLHTVRYGQDREIQFSLNDDCDLTQCRAAGSALADPSAAVTAALESPEGFPPFSSACVPGDQVVITVDDHVPCAVDVVSGAVRALKSGPAGGEIQIRVLCASQDTATRIAERLQLDAIAHDPDNRQELTYLAASKEGLPIYFNRLLHEADVVVPIGAAQPLASLGHHSASGGLYPAFADSAARGRFQAARDSDGEAGWKRRHDEASEAAWLLGAQFAVQVVAGPDDTAMHVVAGDSESVARKSQPLCEQAWCFEPATSAPLVIAAIDGEGVQTWDHFARALHTARRIADEDADIVLCTTLAVPPGPALRQLASDLVDDELERELRRRHTPDVLAAQLLFETLPTAHVHLISDLDPNVVEELGMTPLEPGDLERIASRHGRCLMLPSAHRAAVRWLQATDAPSA